MPRADASLCVGGALVRPKAVFCVFRDRPSTRRAALVSWVRWTAGPPSLLRKAASRRRRAFEGPVRVCSPGVVATVSRAAVHGRHSERRDVAGEARPLLGQVRQDARGRARRPRQAPPPPRRGRRRRAGQLVRIGAGLRRGVDVTASRCFSWPVRSAPSVASKADATLGCYSNSAFFFAVDPQV